MQGFKKKLEEAKERKENRDVIILHVCMFWGALPSLLGAGIRPLGVISVGFQPLSLSCPKVPPFGSGLKFDASPTSHERNRAAVKELHEGAYSRPDRRFQEVVESLAGRRPPYHLLDSQALLPD
jgi:hypothetical protein